MELANGEECFSEDYCLVCSKKFKPRELDFFLWNKTSHKMFTERLAKSFERTSYRPSFTRLEFRNVKYIRTEEIVSHSLDTNRSSVPPVDFMIQVKSYLRLGMRVIQKGGMGSSESSSIRLGRIGLGCVLRRRSGSIGTDNWFLGIVSRGS